MTAKPLKKIRNAGFTIIELLIATSVFAVILLVVMFGITNIGKIYYKGINSSNTQSMTRAISDDISQSVQFSGGAIEVPVTAGDGSGRFCIGDKKYSYVIDRQVEADDKYALIYETSSSCIAASTSSLNGLGEYTPPGDSFKSLLGKGTRLANIELSTVDGVSYEVRVRVVKGDNDLLEDKNSIAYGAAGFDVKTMRCKPGPGSQFCAVSELYTIVNKRI